MSNVEHTKFTMFYEEISKRIKSQIITNELLIQAICIDASCYAYTPKLIIKAQSEEDVIEILKLANKLNVVITFRAAGSSLSGQSNSDSVLVITNDGWKDINISEDGKVIECDCGVIGAKANEALEPYGRKIGPDPATISTALIGGIFSNNSSGMCCGVAQNSYNTIHSVRAILSDGFIIDTNDEESIRNFLANKQDLINKLLSLREDMLHDLELCNLIKAKFSIKNTTGYSINALIDFSDAKDILNHILIGAEGTLAFISKVRYFTQIDARLKICGLLFYKDLQEASNAVVRLNVLQDIVSSAEMMDGSCLMALKSLENMAEILHESSSEDICLLIQSEANDEATLNENLAHIKNELSKTKMIKELYSLDKKEQESWWKLRKSILPIVAAGRKGGSTVITEDVCFKIKDFIAGSMMIKNLLQKYDFSDGVIFGHALSGNLHFNITPNLSDEKEVKRFSNMLQELCAQMARFGGSMKAEHGTGRMVAPFVELEWGQKAYEINKTIKHIFDPNNILNKDVIITQNPNIYKEKLKLTPPSLSLIPSYGDIINKCVECGFCEKVCPSKDITLTPRARIAALRYIELLQNNNKNVKAKELLTQYQYYGNKTCAECSSCARVCPIGIDSARIAKELAERMKISALARLKNQFLAKNINIVVSMARIAISVYGGITSIFGRKNLSEMSRKIHKICNLMPFLPPKMPKANYYKLTNKDDFSEKIIYFTACTNRMFSTKVPLQKSIENICAKAKVSVIYPTNITKMCCGKIYEKDALLFNKNLEFLRKELNRATENGKHKIIIDHSSCFYTLFTQLKDFKILDVSEFLLEIAPRLDITKTDEKILIHQLCLLKKMGKENNIIELANLLSTQVQAINSFECCGFSGNKGFSTPELNQSSTRFLRLEGKDYTRGASSSQTCQIGLNSYSNVDFENIAYYVDVASRAKI